MSERFAAPATVRVARSRPGVRAGVASTVLLLMLAVLKPWAPAVGATASTAGDVPPSFVALVPGGTSGTAVASTPLASAAADPSPGPGEMTCQVEDWQIVSLDRLADWIVRTWTPASAAPATGPLDPAIPTVRLDSPRVLGLGVCAPGSALGPNPAGVGAIGAIWRIASNRAVNVTFAPLVADPTRPPRPGVTSLYRSVHDPAGWAPGRYVIALDVPALADGGVRGRQFLAVVVPVGQ